MTLAKAPPAELLPDGSDAGSASGPPVVATHSGGGEDGGDRGGIAVWADGAVRFTGGSCAHARSGKLPPERVAALLAALEQRGVLVPHDDGKMGHREASCCDCVTTVLNVTSGDKHAKLVDEGCGTDPGALYHDAMALFGEAVGRSPCAY